MTRALRRALSWLLDLFARCARCGLRLPLVRSDRASWWRTAGGAWICPFCLVRA